MSGGRKTVPLFDLLPKKPGIEDRGRVGQPVAPPAVASEVEPKPSPVAVPATLEPRHIREDQPATSAEPEGASDAIVVPRFAFAIIIACLTALLVLAWAAGVRFGHVQSEQDQAAKIQENEAPLLGAGSPKAAPETPVVTPDPQPAKTPTPSPAQPAASGSGSIYGPEGWSEADPRQKGMNYLRLATLNRDQAVQTVDYIKQKGKRAVAVPSGTVDRSPVGGKNPTYFVYLLTPLSRDQYRDVPLRTRVENEIKDIGKQWAKQKERGPTDFSQPGWVKYE